MKLFLFASLLFILNLKAYTHDIVKISMNIKFIEKMLINFLLRTQANVKKLMVVLNCQPTVKIKIVNIWLNGKKVEIRSIS